ncbi:hypothetical protein [Sphingobium yanoikuyae]|uniref:Uncharacterized protein n=1 Tax=Sphingobium yanoikuyae TaxID=13690 RepID=A0A3G2UN32_SPHYA|nr:hypothetical protein [Sphingobium yanoikuyae]AYO76466.1 hypothetical protein EBF16_05605 [Sphingobium yanoikuyae]
MSAALPELAERMQRAIVNGRGIRFEAGDLDLLVAIGVNDLVQTENAKLLREQCLTRTMKSRSIPGGQPSSEGQNTGSGGTGGRTDRFAPPTSTSSGTTPIRDTSGLARRAQRMSGRQKKGSTPSSSNGSEGSASATSADS